MVPWYGEVRMGEPMYDEVHRGGGPSLERSTGWEGGGSMVSKHPDIARY